MVARRRYRRASNRRKTYRKRIKPMMLKAVRPKIHYFKRTLCEEIQINLSGFVPIPQVQARTAFNEFLLTDIPGYTEFQAIYDSYKICAIKQKYVFNRNSSAAETVTSTELPMLYTINDYNDSNAATNLNEMLEYPSFKQARMDRPITRYFKCKNMVSGTEPTKAQWLPTSLTPTGAQYSMRGIKAAYDTILGTASGIGKLRVFTTFYLAMKSPK